MNACKTPNGHNRAIARRIPCVCLVDAAEATFDYTQEDKLDDSSCGDTMILRLEGEAAAAQATTVVFGVLGWF